MNLKEVKQRIASVKNTQKITSAMKLISAAKLRKAQGAIENMLPYQSKLNAMLAGFLAAGSSFSTPYTRERETKRVALIVTASNASLCGGFNATVIRRFRETVHCYTAQIGADNLQVYTIGRKAAEAARKMNLAHHTHLQQLSEQPGYDGVAQVATRLMHLFETEQLDRVELIYNHFKSASQQQLTHTAFLPVDLSAAARQGEAAQPADYIVEPSAPQVMERLLPKVLCSQLFTMLLDSAAAEHAARLIAMQTATDNANELITDLTREYNKGRQQAITSELLDIAAGSLN